MKNRANPENCRELNRKYLATEKGKAARNRAQVNYRKRNRKKQLAHDAVAYAVRMKVLIPSPCWVCGKVAQAHHPDYDRPLDVVWLCDMHHKQVHALVANEPRRQDAA
jgi:hypothetical protein